MAERRMFAKTIVLSDAFLDMPITARCLYFTLGMLADDDGFVNNPKSIMRQCGASMDDLNILALKKYILIMGDGIVVIKHWRIHNYIQSDRYTPTKYQELKDQLSLDENKAYTECIQSVYKVDTQDRLGKVSKGKESIGKESIEKDIYDLRFDEFWSAYPKKTGKGAAIKSWEKIKPDKELFDTIMTSLEAHKGCEQWNKQNGQFIPNPATWLNQMRWEDEVQVAQSDNPFFMEALNGL